MKKHLILIVYLLTIYINATAQVCLTPPGSPYSLSQQPFSLTSADFNNDGKTDIASADRFANSVTVLFGDGSNNFLTTNAFTLSVSGPISITNGDFNEDGNIDIAVANNSSANVTLLIGDGVGGFTPTSNFPVGSAPQSITRADFNSDGFEDLAVANNSSNNVSVLLGTGTGSFAAAVSYSAGTGPMSIISADFNNDSNLDLGVANYTGNNVSILLGNGVGGFGAATNFTVGSFPRSITYADFNFDSFWDIAVSNDLSSGTVSVLLGNGTGSFASSGTFPVGTNPYSISTGDFNSDGIIDLATANINSQNVSVLPGNGAGSFGTAVNFSVGTSLRAVISTDFNSDARTDLVSANFSSLSIFLNQPPPVTANSTQSVICLGDNITLTGGGANTYSWSNGVIDGVPFMPSITTTYSLTGTNLNGCSNNANVTITVNTPISFTILPSTPIICETAIVNLTVTPGGTYTISPGGQTGDLFSVSPASTTIYTIETVDMNSCYSSQLYTITVNPQPSVSFNINSPVCENGTISFTNSSSISTGTFSNAWSGPNSFTSADINPTIPFATNLMTGDYTLTATSDQGCSSFMSMPVTVNPLPLISAFASSSTICAGETLTLTAFGGSTYLWNHNGDPNFETTDVPIGNTNYIVTGTDGSGCSNTGSVFVNVNTPSFLSFTPSSASICEGSSASFTVTPAGTYSISPGGQIGSTFTVSPLNTSSYTIDGYDLNGCYVTDIYNVTVNENPIAGGSASNACFNGDIILFNSSSIGIGTMTYQWSGPNLYSSTAQTPTITSADFTMSGDYTLTVTSDLGCIDDAVISVTVNSLPTINAVASPSTICAGETVTLTASGGLNYEWQHNLNTNFEITESPIGNTNYNVIGTDINGCSNNMLVLVIVLNPDPLSFSPPLASICLGTSADFTVSPGGTYTLSPGANTGDIFSVSPLTTTNYTIEGIGPNGCFTSGTYNVNVNDTPIAGGSASNTCVNGDIVLFNSSSIGIGTMTYQWSGPNSYTSTAQSPTITAADLTMSGDYTLTVTSDLGCTDDAVISVTVNPLPTVNISGPTSICAGTSSTLTATGALSYTWSTNDNTSSIVITPTVASTYTVEGEDGNGCKNNAGTFISVDTPIPFTVSPSSPSICVGSSVSFTVSPTSTYTLQPGGTTGDVFNESPSLTTTYTIQGNDINGCDITNTYDIFLYPQPIASANFNQAVICENNNLNAVNTSTINGGTISSYAWSGPNTFSSSNDGFNISNATTLASGDYTLTVTSDQSCVDVAIISATVNPKPNVSATASATNICSSATATLTASGANTYTWSTNANGTSTTVTPTIVTTYSVFGENTFGCKDTSSIQINTISSKVIDGIATTTVGTANGEATIYKFSPILSKWDSVTTVNFTPNFNFGQLDSGNYVIRAIPSATNIQTTYGNSSISWQNATIINHGCTANSSQTITLIPFANIGTGSGSISGTVTQTVGFGQRPFSQSSVMVPLAPGNPIGGIIVKGGKNPGGNMFAQTETSADGTYTITGIPNTSAGESIFVFIDIPGLDTAGNYCRTFVSGETYNGLDFVVDSANIIAVNPNECLNVGISENNFKTNLNVYPNPAKDILNIDFELKEKANVSIELIDVIGKTTAAIESNKLYTAQKHKIPYQLNDIPNGVYFVKISLNESIINQKIIINR